MKHENLFKIYIPEPCHEDWGKMTPNQQGAFCKSCCKTVVDFSNKSKEEINNYLSENTDKKICGRFKVSQVDEVPKLKNEIPKIQFPGYMFPINNSSFKAYALALFAVAALGLAGCTSSGNESAAENNETVYEQVMGKSVYQPETNNLNNNTNNLPDSTEVTTEPMINGGLCYRPVKDTALVIDTTQEIKLLGEVYIKPDTLKTNTQKENIKMGKIKKVEEPKEKEYLKGDVKTEK